MAEALEVMSVEDSRVMDVSLCSASTAVVQSTSRSWKRRLLLAVVPVLGLAAVVIAALSQGLGGTAKNASAFKNVGILEGDLAVARDNKKASPFRTLLEERATGSDLKDHTKFWIPQTQEELSVKCPEEGSLRDGSDRFLPGADSDFGRKVKFGLEYRGVASLEPSNPNSLDDCRDLGESDCKFYCDQGSASGKVTTAVRMMELAQNISGVFFSKYRKVRTFAYMKRESTAGKHFVGLTRPAAGAKSLFDLRATLNDGLGFHSFHSKLLMVVYSALRQLPDFYKKSRYPFHGGLSSRSVEVLVGEEGPMMAYVTGYADAILGHMKREEGEEVELQGLPPWEALQNNGPSGPNGTKQGPLTDKIDTWSVGLAMLELLFLNGGLDALRVFDENLYRFCNENLITSTAVKRSQPVSMGELKWFQKTAINFVRTHDSVKEYGGEEFLEVLERMMAFDPRDRWNVPTALEQLEERIKKLAREEVVTILGDALKQGTNSRSDEASAAEEDVEKFRSINEKIKLNDEVRAAEEFKQLRSLIEKVQSKDDDKVAEALQEMLSLDTFAVQARETLASYMKHNNT